MFIAICQLGQWYLSLTLKFLNKNLVPYLHY